MSWRKRIHLSVALGLGFAAATAQADVFDLGTGLTSLEMVHVGNPGNIDDTTGYGGVPYAYQIGKYEVTAAQYTEFLNAVAKSDPYGLYRVEMADWSGYYGCNIQRSGSEGSYAYSIAADWANRPVNMVSWGDAARFVNWLQNGQPTGAQDLTTTEDGAYYLNGAVSDADLLAVTRKADATWFLPSENEWYKAAYHKNDGATANYWTFPTASNAQPGRDITEATSPGNNANYFNGTHLIPTYSRSEVGEFELSDSPYGTFDQGGNVQEWNEALKNDLYRGRRGGTYFVGGVVMGKGFSQFDYPTTQPPTLGFRVASVPEPASIVALLSGAAAGLTLRRRRRR